MTTSDPVGTAVASIGAGATTGAVVVTVGVLLLRTLQSSSEPEAVRETGDLVLGITVFAGFVAAAASGWLRTRAIDDLWRRGVTATLSVFGTTLLGLLAAPADTIGGRPGLAAYLLLLLVAAFLTHGAARRAASR